MSTQPSAPGRASSRFSRPVGYVRDLPIWTKLGLIMIVPTLATIIVGTVGSARPGRAGEQRRPGPRARRALRRRRQPRPLRCRTSGPSSSSCSARRRRTTERLKAEYATRQQQTDTANGRYRLSRSTLADIPDNLRALLDRIETQLGELPVLRSQVERPSPRCRCPPPSASTGCSSPTCSSIPDLSAQLTGDTTLTDRMRAAAAVATRQGVPGPGARSSSCRRWPTATCPRPSAATTSPRSRARSWR